MTQDDKELPRSDWYQRGHLAANVYGVAVREGTLGPSH